MAKKTPEHGLRVTPGSFQLRGIAQGVKNQKFFTEKDIPGTTTKMRSVNFGVKYDVTDISDGFLGKVVYPTVQGFTRPKVYFSKRKQDGTTETKEVAWEQRLEFAKNNPDFRVIGCNIGLEKDEEGKNIKQYLTEYDAAKAVKDKLQDDMSVFVRGTLDFRSYTTDKGEVRRQQNFNATQISLCAEVDFEEEGFEAVNDFEQEIIYTGIEKEVGEGDKLTGRYILNGYVVSFNAIEPVSFIVEDAKFANLIRKNLKAYDSIKTHGKIVVSHIVSTGTEEESDEWGDSNPMANNRVNAPTKRELVLTGASPSTITKDFSEESVAEGIRKLKTKEKVNKNFGEKKETVTTSDDWGTPASSNDEEEDW